jgi:hypothetical protein
VDERIKSALPALLLGKDLQGSEPSGDNAPALSKAKQKAKKGYPKVIVKMSDIKTPVFGNMNDPEKIYGKSRNKAKRGLPDPENGGVWKWKAKLSKCTPGQSEEATML